MGQYSKYKLYIKEEYDGSSWSPVIPYEYYAEMTEEYSTDCGWTDSSTEYLTFIAKGYGHFYFSGSTLNRSVNKISYSLDSGTTWSEPQQQVEVTVNSGDVVMWKGVMKPKAAETSTATIGIGKFTWFDRFYEYYAPFDVRGNVLSLIYGDNFSGQTSLPSGYRHVFTDLFQKSNVIDASQLCIPCEELLEGTCFGMFNYCQNLTKAPQLPATTLANYCYADMFTYCTSLAKAPDLTASTLSDYCYSSMFHGCSSLNNIKMIATSIAFGCFEGWVNGVSSSGTFIKKASTTLPTGTSGIPTGWSVQNV